VRTDESDAGRPAYRAAALADARLGFLLKHAQLRFAVVAQAALQPYGIDGRELAVLSRLSGPDPMSQQEAARQLGIDRTTMVALIDGLEGKHLVERHTDPGDRRKNIVELTAAGRETLAPATEAADEAERRFLGPLGEADAQRFKDVLRTLLSA
jgi:DNA-binding MarR family transcriptional regulator